MQESKEREEHKEEKLIDIKGTLKQFVEADEPELSQEEAIMKYEEPKEKKNKNYNNYNNNNDDDMDTTEEEEHLKRIKQELLASLKRVEKLEELLFKKKLNVKNSKGGGFTSSKSLSEKETETKKRNQKERE